MGQFNGTTGAMLDSLELAPTEVTRDLDGDTASCNFDRGFRG